MAHGLDGFFLIFLIFFFGFIGTRIGRIGRIFPDFNFIKIRKKIREKSVASVQSVCHLNLFPLRHRVKMLVFRPRMTPTDAP